MVVKKTCIGFGSAITAALLILSCPTIQDRLRNEIATAVNNNIVGLNLIFSLHLILCGTNVFFFFVQLKTISLRYFNLAKTIQICFAIKEKNRTLIHNLRLATLFICCRNRKYHWSFGRKHIDNKC
jgi:hypothetical protein